MDVTHLTGVVLNELQRFFELHDGVINPVLLVVRIAEVLVHLEVGLPIELYRFFILLYSSLRFSFEFIAISHLC